MKRIAGEERDDALELVNRIQEERSGKMLGDVASSQVPYILLPYQVAWHEDMAVTRLMEKGRRIGFTWGGWGAEAVLEAGRPGRKGMSQYYMGYNQGMAAEFIGDCATFARWFNAACSEVDVGYEQVLVENERQDILTYKIHLASGHEILALSSAPHNWRGRQGHARIDEAGHHKNLEAVVAGALAFRIWGGRISIGGTHNGEENPFNGYVRDCKAGKLPWSLHRVTFDDALRMGLYKRICLVRGLEWSPEAEIKFRAEAYADYPVVELADEELQCVPRRGTGAYFSRMLIEACNVPAPVQLFSKRADFVLDSERFAVADAWIEEHLAPTVEALPRGVDYALGQDFGRSGDLSTIDVLGQKSPTRWDTVFMVEMRNIPFDVQLRIARWVGDNLPSWRRWKLDARGNGHSHAEALMQEYGSDRVECVQLTGQWYDEWFPKYKAAFEGQNRGIPATEDIIDDHRQVVLVAGSPRMSASRTKGSDGLPRHGDSAVSGVLAWSAAVGGAQPSAGETVDAQPGGFTPSRGSRASEGMFGRIKERPRQRPQERAQRSGAISASQGTQTRTQGVPDHSGEG